MTNTQTWFLIIEVGIIAFYCLIMVIKLLAGSRA